MSLSGYDRHYRLTFADCTVWFGQRVATMNDAVDQGLFGVLVVTSVWVAYAIAARTGKQIRSINKCSPARIDIIGGADRPPLHSPERVVWIRIDWFGDNVLHGKRSMDDRSCVNNWSGMDDGCCVW